MADFVRKSQLANYEAYRAMYEGRNAKLFNPSTAVITWMSNPAQPSFVWQLYHHDLEPNSGLFAVQKSGEMVHIQLNELTGDLEVINNTPELLKDAKAHIAVYNLAGELKVEKDFDVAGAPSSAIDLGAVDPLDNDWQWPTELSQQVHFFKLSLKDSTGKLISENFYWRGGNNTFLPGPSAVVGAKPVNPDNLQAMDTMKPVTLKVSASQQATGDKIRLTVTLSNPGPGVAVMAHLQLRHGKAPETPEQQTAEQAIAARVLPVYYSDNYISLVPNETRIITIEAAQSDLKGEPAILVLDGWNIALDATGSQVPVTLNTNAQVAHWNVTNLPIVAHTWK
jgi:beta-mannosidase